MSDELVPVGTPIDLDNCAREPIHVPGSIQPRGVLAVVEEPSFQVRQISANVGDLLGKSVEDVLGAPLSALIGVDRAESIERAAAAFGDLRQRNPHDCTLQVGGVSRAFDAILHREPGGVLLVELEIAYGERPFSFPNTYQAVRDSIEDLNRANTLTDLYVTAARAVRDLTGFDRVMVYRYDQDYNGEVVAEAKREDLNSFLGLHYPASDIPAQARALYEKNWLRLIDDVDYVPAPLIPSVNPTTGGPLDLTHATLRSVSPIHLEYLRNMGVRASMSISLLRRGKLWGLIACHHYAGPHLPPYGSRAAAEFLGSTLSLRLVDKDEDDRLHQRLAAQRVLGKLTAATFDDEPVTTTLLGPLNVLDLVPADGVVAHVEGLHQSLGVAPADEVVAAVVEWARATGDDVASSDFLSDELAGRGLDPKQAAGALVLNLPDDQYVVWFRGEVLRSVDWVGDPHNKAIATREGDHVRLSPRKSFDRWREIVDRRSEPWTPTEVESAEALRHHLVESLYRRTRSALVVAETLQRSLLPQSIPHLRDWQLSAHYQPAEGGRVGGDWYDAFELRDGRLIVVLGDVAGHGITAAGEMAQLRNVLRGYLFAGLSPAEALTHLNEFCVHQLARPFATVVVARVELDTGRVEVGCAGHMPPYVVSANAPALEAPIRRSPAIGIRGVDYAPSAFTVERGHGLVLFSDGLVERRGEVIDDGLDRLAALLGDTQDVVASSLSAAMRTSETDDDVTIVTLRRL